MADSTGFLKYERKLPPRRPVDLRLLDWKDVYLARQNGEDEVFPLGAVREQAARCMDCGIPFCHHGCPLGNLIPEWNDLVWRDDWDAAALRFTKVMPVDFKRVLEATADAERDGRDVNDAIMEAARG